MYLNMTGIWHIWLEADHGRQEGTIRLPGTMQAQGYGNDITRNTPWVSSLHDAKWWKREEYQYAQEQGVSVPFLAQPQKHYLGKVNYERNIVVDNEEDDTWYLYIELTHWRTKAYVDGVQTGEDCSVCTAHILRCGRLSRGTHTIRVEIDNSMQYPYRPDAHGVSDSLGATWNGMAGEIALFTESELERRIQERKEYAAAHPRRIEIKGGSFCIDGKPQYLRGTHFGGDYPLTGCPVTDKAWWRKLMQVIKVWGLNFIRCHSYCPPEAAFAAADEEGVYIQPECGMWNHFEEGIPMLEILRKETRRILEQFGHHPSFVLFSPTNEPSGNWYQVLRDWVTETREYDRLLGYEHRRVYTAQSGWFYDAAPSEVQGVDYLYFHRSAYGPYLGGTIRGMAGWKGKDYSPSLTGTDKPVICHELGQWCAYPDYDIIQKFGGYMQARNLEVFRENCRAHGLLALNKSFAYASGRNQVRLYKEDIEANLRTPEISGFELLDLHDYMGQGTALVGLLDALWEEKGYIKPEEFRQFCTDTVLLAAFASYVYTTKQAIKVPVSVCHYGDKAIDACVIEWELSACTSNNGKTVIEKGMLAVDEIKTGCNTFLGTVSPNMEMIRQYVRVHGHQRLMFRLTLEGITQNTWELYVYDEESTAGSEKTVLYTQDWRRAKAALESGGRVVYAPFLSDMDYECPPLSIRNVFWNGQMGPSWGRNLGMIADMECPLFDEFPTTVDGGWQWEDIFLHARGFHMQGSLKALQPIVRIIDDWNRNLPLALILEAQVGRGSLLLVSADLEGLFDDRPAAYALRRALMHYASSEAFAPKIRIQAEDIERSLFPVLRMETLTAGTNNLTQSNPNKAMLAEQEEFPVFLPIILKKRIAVQGIMYVPDQRERDRAAFPKDVTVQIWSEADNRWEEVQTAVLHNSSLSQKIVFDEAYMTDKLRLAVHSCYGGRKVYQWEEYSEGYRYMHDRAKAAVSIAGLHILCEEEAPHNNELFWLGQQSSTTKEIEA